MSFTIGELGERAWGDSLRSLENAVDRRNNPAEYLHDVLIKQIRAFENNLSSDEELGMRLASSGYHEPFRLTEIGYSNPSFIIFRGETADGRPVEVIQHHSLVSLMLVAVAKAPEHVEARRIGFLDPAPDAAP